MDYINNPKWDFSKELQAEKERLKDIAEANVYQALIDGDLNITKWYLALLAKDRGYAPENQTVNIINAQQNTVSQEKALDALTDDEREQYFELCRKMNGDEVE